MQEVPCQLVGKSARAVQAQTASSLFEGRCSSRENNNERLNSDLRKQGLLAQGSIGSGEEEECNEGVRAEDTTMMKMEMSHMSLRREESGLRRIETFTKEDRIDFLKCGRSLKETTRK